MKKSDALRRKSGRGTPDRNGRVRPRVGLFFSGGATLTERDDLASGMALVGRPVWGPGGLLKSLKLRLGLARPDAAERVRVQRWSRQRRVFTRLEALRDESLCSGVFPG